MENFLKICKSLPGTDDFRLAYYPWFYYFFFFEHVCSVFCCIWESRILQTLFLFIFRAVCSSIDYADTFQMLKNEIWLLLLHQSNPPHSDYPRKRKIKFKFLDFYLNSKKVVVVLSTLVIGFGWIQIDLALSSIFHHSYKKLVVRVLGCSYFKFLFKSTVCNTIFKAIFSKHFTIKSLTSLEKCQCFSRAVSIFIWKLLFICWLCWL